MRTATDLLDAAKAAGLDVTGIELVPVAGGGEAISARMRFEDPWAAARLLVELSAQDAGDPVVRAWAQDIAEATAEELGAPPGPTIPPALRDDIARALHANVQSQIHFVHEPIETFQAAWVTMQAGEGDCDDHARLLYALAGALMIPVEMTFFEEWDPAEGQTVPAHAVVRMQDSDGSWQWAETTIDADYGEEPHDALDRLAVDDGANPLAHVSAGASSGAARGLVGARAGMGGPFGFVTPSDVQARKDELEAIVAALDSDIVGCGSAIDSGTLTAWNTFQATWTNFYLDAPGWTDAGDQQRQTAAYAVEIQQWQTKLAPLCKLSAPPLPTLPEPPPDSGDNVTSAIKLVAVAAAVIAGAYVAGPLVRAAVRR